MLRRSLRFRLVNVFAEDSRWSGNALAVLEDARDLSDVEMQAIASEDTGTGSACANLGGWHLATKARLPIDLVVRQGEKTGRRCRLRLRVDAAQRILVSGRVVEIGRGEFDAG